MFVERMVGMNGMIFVEVMVMVMVMMMMVCFRVVFVVGSSELYVELCFGIESVDVVEEMLNQFDVVLGFLELVVYFRLFLDS